MGSNAHGPLKLPHNTPTMCNLSSKRTHWPYLSCLLDDIIIWSQPIEEHEKNVSLVLEALRAAQLYCSSKKPTLFTTKLNFLWHTISQCGIKADGSKVEHILNWPTPQTAKEVCQFLRLVCYISTFLLSLAEYTSLLNPLTCKECNTHFPP